MASNYTNLGVQLMTTGEKAGTWGTLTNTNWNIIEQIAGGYTTQALTDDGTLTLTKNDGTTGATLATRIIKLTGTLSAGNSVVTVPDSIENWWLVNNAEGGSTYTVTFKTVSGTGVAWAAGETGTKLLFSDGTNVVDSGLGLGDVTLAGTGTYLSIIGQAITVDPITESDISDLGVYITDITGSPLSELSDTTITTIASGELLKWNGTAWINNTLAEAGISATGHTHTASDVTDFDTEVANNSAVALNTAKTTNATHTGEVTGSDALTLDKTAISNQADVTMVATDILLFGDTSDTNNLKKGAVQDILDLVPASGGLTWNEETGTSATMSVANGYIANNAALVTLTLPTTASVGDIIRVTGKGAGGWKIAQNASEIIHFGVVDSTTGTGGSLASTETYDSVELVCVVANNEWVVISSVGNITIV